MASKYAPHALRIEPADEYDNAIVGHSKDGLIIYSYHRIIQILTDYHHMDEDDARDWADYNIFGSINPDKPEFKVSYALKHKWKSTFTFRKVLKKSKSR